MSDSVPTLWQIDISHYSEKARWALTYKGVTHRRRSPVPGAHMPIALWLSRGSQATFPILVLDGGPVCDSTAIIAALEARYPDPALYPEDPAQRRRALELEDFFDEELGPHIRQLAWYELREDRARLEAVMAETAPGPMAKIASLTARYASAYTGLRFRSHDAEAAQRGREKVLAALDRLEAELDAGEGEYLVGEEFTVADLTAASLFYPLVLPAEGPLGNELAPAAGIERFREPLKERPGYRWIAEMFRRHRKPGRPVAATTAR